jgi:uncharacterized membrane protein
MLLGLGAATKIYPGFLALPLLLERVAAGDWRGAARVVAGTGGVWLVLNLPFVLANRGGWWATYEFQAGRVADLTTNSIWYWGLPQLSTEQVNRWSFALIAASWLLAVLAGAAVARRTGSYPWIQVSAALICAFLLFNKVYSPQYVLWLLPFFVLVRVRWGWWVAYLAVDLTLYVGLFRWYYDITQGGDFGVAKQAAVLGVWGKAVLLGLLYVVFLISPLSFRPSGPRSAGAPARSSAGSPRRWSAGSPARSSAGSPARPPEEPTGDAPDRTSTGPESGASSSTPPAGSSTPADRTTSRSG